MLEMYIEADIFKKLPRFLSDSKKSILPKANKRAINRTLPKVEKDVKFMARRTYNLKGKKLSNKLKRKKAVGNSVPRQMGEISISGRAISLTEFMTKSQLKIKSDKGIPNSKRRRLRVMIKPGNKLQLKAFVQKAKSKDGFGVFKRKGSQKHSSGKSKIAFQKAPSLAHAMDIKFKYLDGVRRRGAATYAREFEKTFAFFIKQKLKRIG